VVLAAVVALGAGLLGGCGSGDDGDADAPIDPARREAARAWTEQICASILEWQDAIGVLAQQGEPESRDEFVTFFSGSVDATRRLVRELEAAGVPEVTEGRRTADTYVEAFTRARQISTDGLARAEGLPAEITAEERLELQRLIQDGYGEISATFEEAGEEVDSPELTEAFTENPDCAAVS
jgi:hypothetical protein